MKLLEVDEPYPATAARCTLLVNKQGNRRAYVTVSDEARFRTPMEIAALLAHEAVHIKQFAVEAMDDKSPSMEFEAYAVQSIFMELVQAWQKTRSPRLLRG